jgi:hypothetical protein
LLRPVVSTHNGFSADTHPAYGPLLTSFGPSLRQQQPASLLQLKDGDPYEVMLVPPWDWYDQQDRLVKQGIGAAAEETRRNRSANRRSRLMCVPMG